MTCSEIVLSPRPKIGMLDCVTLGERGSHEVLGRSMYADLGGHAPDDGNLVRDLCNFRQVLRDLIIRFGADRFPWPLSRAGLGIKGIDVAHASFDLKEDDSLGLAETVPSANWFCRTQVGQNRKPEGPEGTSLDECSSFQNGVRHVVFDGLLRY